MADKIAGTGETTRQPSILDAVNELEAQRKVTPPPTNKEVSVLPTRQLSEAERIQAGVDRARQIGQNLGSTGQSVAEVAFQQSVNQANGLPTTVDNVVNNLREGVANQPVKESLMSKILRLTHLKQ